MASRAVGLTTCPESASEQNIDLLGWGREEGRGRGRNPEGVRVRLRTVGCEWGTRQE